MGAPFFFIDIGTSAIRIDSLRTEFSSRLGRPAGFFIAGIRCVITRHFAVMIHKVQPPAIDLLANRHLARLAMGFHRLLSSQRENCDAAMDKEVGNHGTKLAGPNRSTCRFFEAQHELVGFAANRWIKDTNGMRVGRVA